jgi:hypothetical protein
MPAPDVFSVITAPLISAASGLIGVASVGRFGMSTVPVKGPRRHYVWRFLAGQNIEPRLPRDAVPVLPPADGGEAARPRRDRRAAARSGREVQWDAKEEQAAAASQPVEVQSWPTLSLRMKA